MRDIAQDPVVKAFDTLVRRLDDFEATVVSAVVVRGSADQETYIVKSLAVNDAWRQYKKALKEEVSYD